MMHTTSKPKRGNIVIYLALLVAAIGSMAALSRCSRSGAAATVAGDSGDTLQVAMEFSPVIFYSYGDTLGGFSYDLLRHIATTHHVPMNFHPIVTLEKALAGLDEGTYDIVVAQFPVTSENKRKFLFTTSLYLDNQVLVQRKARDGSVAVSSQLDLAGDTVTIVAGSPMRQRIEGLSREIGDSIHIVEDADYGPEQLLLMVEAGEIKLAVINESIARSMAKKHPGVDVSTQISFSQFQSLTLRRGEQALCDSLNSWIEQAKQSPVYPALTRRYLK